MSAMAPVALTIDGQPVTVPGGTSVFDAARGLGIEIPVLCHAQHQTPVGVCRICAVDVGAPVLAASCVRLAEDGMNVQTGSDRVLRARRTLYELLLADHPSPCARQRATADCELETQAARSGVGDVRLPRGGSARGLDDSSHFIRVDHTACIMCDRCLRGCTEVMQNFVIGRTGKGYEATIGFDTNVEMAESTCVGCGECMVSCPTGALTNKAVLDVELAGDRLTSADLKAFPIFARMSGNFLELNREAIVRRTFRPGEVICREGEFGASAFYVLRGRVDVFLASRTGHVENASEGPHGIKDFFRRLTGLAASPPPEGLATRRLIPIDALVDVELSNPIAQLGPGDVFGEMTCLNFYPRSATVRAVEETEVLELLRNVLDMLRRDKRFRAELDRRYRERVLDGQLRSLPIFAGVSDDFLDLLRQRAELVRAEPGQVICRQGEPADSFYLVRLGCVKVSQAFPGGDLVLQYLARGDAFGEIGLLGGGARVATCTAQDHVELVRIAAAEFNHMLERFPQVRARLTDMARVRIESNERRRRTISTVPLDEFLDQGIMEAQNLLLLDLERCTRCDLCVRACAQAHAGITRLVRDGLRFDKYLVATSCRSCRDPLCMVGCPVGSIHRREDTLEIRIEDWCIGCGRCAAQCPYGNINIHPVEVAVGDPERPGRTKAVLQPKATTCDLSREYDEPVCVYACPHDAAIRVEPLKFFAGRLGPRT